MKGEGEGGGGEGVQQPTYTLASFTTLHEGEEREGGGEKGVQQLTYTLASFTVSHERGRGREGKRRQYNSQHIH